MANLEPETLLRETLARIEPVSQEAWQRALDYQETLTKPSKSLGRLEQIGNQLSAITDQCPPPAFDKCLVTVFGADHGCAPKTSPWPQEVTIQMGRNIVFGGASVSVLARHAGADLRFTDVGMLTSLDLPSSDFYQERRLRAGSSDLTAGPAMSREEAIKALVIGIETAQWAVDQGYQAVLPGEIGIGNTSPAATVISLLTGKPIDQVTGRGSDPTGNKYQAKVAALREALEVNRPDPDDPIDVLTKVGGFDQGAMAGVIIGAAANQLPVILDGVIACSAALIAVKLNPAIQGYLIAGHNGAEPGIKAANEVLGLEAVLDMGMCLGEGSGAVAALPVIQGAAKLMREVATFESASVISEHE